MRLLLFIVGAVAATVYIERPAQAENYPWCAYYDFQRGGATNCGWATFEQCLPEFVAAKHGTEWQPFKFGSVSAEHAAQVMTTKVRMLSVGVMICLVLLVLVFVDNSYAQAMEELMEELIDLF